MIKGSIVALITPFNDLMEVNYNKLCELIEKQIEASSDALLILGTTSESPTLSKEEKENIINLTIKVVDKRVPIIVGVSNNNTILCSEEVNYYSKMNIDALLVLTPYYNKCNEEGMYNHFKYVANNSTKPIIIYNIPNRTGISITYDVLEGLSCHKNIIGIKEANPNFKESLPFFNLINNNFNIYCGNDEYIIPFLSLGSKGAFNVSGNIIPNQIKEVIDLALHDNFNLAKKKMDTIYEFINALFLETNPIPIKTAMNMIGLDVGEFRMPLCQMSKDNYIKLEKKVSEIFGTSITC